jgi:hypothetical protein
LVNAFETSPTAVAAHSADVAGPASVKVSSKADAPSYTGAFGAAPQRRVRPPPHLQVPQRRVQPARPAALPPMTLLGRALL